MATTTAKNKARRTTPRAQHLCPTCGFRGATAAGLARHRTTKHGRQIGSAGSDAELERRVRALEVQYQALLLSLERALIDVRLGRGPKRVRGRT